MFIMGDACTEMPLESFTFTFTGRRAMQSWEQDYKRVASKV